MEEWMGTWSCVWLWKTVEGLIHINTFNTWARKPAIPLRFSCSVLVTDCFHAERIILSSLCFWCCVTWMSISWCTLFQNKSRRWNYTKILAYFEIQACGTFSWHASVFNVMPPVTLTTMLCVLKSVGMEARGCLQSDTLYNMQGHELPPSLSCIVEFVLRSNLESVLTGNQKFLRWSNSLLYCRGQWDWQEGREVQVKKKWQ